MNKVNNVLTKRVHIKNKLGLHARPAAQIAQIAKTANKKIWIIKADEKVDASSIIDILTLAALHGTEITLQIDDPADIAVMDAIETLFRDGFGE